MRLHPLSLLTLILAGAVACVADLPTSPESPIDRPMLTGNSCGGYSPTSAEIAVDSMVIFSRDSIQIPCASRYGEINPANGTAGFTQGSACALTGTTGTLVFKVRGCDEGSVELKIYTDSTKTTLLQTIPISVGIL